MDRRTHEGPMDFEYQNGTGPLDSRSPFAQISMNAQRQASYNSSDPSTKKRGLHAAFGSPSKSTFGLRQPTSSQTHLFNLPTQPPSPPKQQLPPSSFSLRNNALFSTPRKLDVDSSGGETPKSPEHAAASDTDYTPDTNVNFRSQAARFDAATQPSFTAGSKPDLSPTKEKKRRDSWWGRTMATLTNSPGQERRERNEVVHSKPYSDKIVKRVKKRRSRDRLKALVRARVDSISESEGEDHRLMSPRKTSGNRQLPKEENKGPLAMVYNFFDFLDAHPTLPHVLSWYAQLLLNIFLFTGVMYILWSFWSTIRSDVDKKSNEAIADLLAEMAVCAQQYTENRCARETRVPAMEVVCGNWEKCMNRDTKSVGRARVSAHTFAEIFNSFLEPISYKAMIFSLLLVFGCVALSNLPFSMFRNRANQAQAAANHHHYYGNSMPPPTPQRQFSNPNAVEWTPWGGNQVGGALEPAPSAGFGQVDGQESPVRRLQFR